MRPRWQRIGLKVLYWAAVLAVSLALLVALILLIESRDQSSVGNRAVPPSPSAVSDHVPTVSSICCARPITSECVMKCRVPSDLRPLNVEQSSINGSNSVRNKKSSCCCRVLSSIGYSRSRSSSTR